MSTKREARKQRAEAQRLLQAQKGRQKKWRSRALVAVGAIAIIATALFAIRRDGGENQGRVWSAAHGHWHEK